MLVTIVSSAENAYICAFFMVNFKFFSGLHKLIMFLPQL